MPPKTKVTKEEIVSAALEAVRQEGEGGLNARRIARRLCCSTQPVFSNYRSMEDLRKDVLCAASRFCAQRMDRLVANSNMPPYKAMGMAYITLAMEERELFRFLYMRPRTEAEMQERAETEQVVAMIAEKTGLDADTAYLFHLEMWLYVHGIAVTAATSFVTWKEEQLSQMLTDMYDGLLLHFGKRGI